MKQEQKVIRVTLAPGVKRRLAAERGDMSAIAELTLESLASERASQKREAAPAQPAKAKIRVTYRKQQPEEPEIAENDPNRRQREAARAARLASGGKHRNMADTAQATLDKLFDRSGVGDYTGQDHGDFRGARGPQRVDFDAHQQRKRAGQKEQERVIRTLDKIFKRKG